VIYSKNQAFVNKKSIYFANAIPLCHKKTLLYLMLFLNIEYFFDYNNWILKVVAGCLVSGKGNCILRGSSGLKW